MTVTTRSLGYVASTSATHDILLEIKADCYSASGESITKPGTGPFADDTYTIHATAKILTYTNWDSWTTSRTSCQLTYSVLVNGTADTNYATVVAGSGV